MTLGRNKVHLIGKAMKHRTRSSVVLEHYIGVCIIVYSRRLSTVAVPLAARNYVVSPVPGWGKVAVFVSHWTRAPKDGDTREFHIRFQKVNITLSSIARGIVSFECGESTITANIFPTAEGMKKMNYSKSCTRIEELNKRFEKNWLYGGSVTKRKTTVGDYVKITMNELIALSSKRCSRAPKYGKLFHVPYPSFRSFPHGILHISIPTN
ncbi:hypothetical protein TNIN_140651 [Trichonephila inaurata madagascariensis]|uniref:Uncharacterized protein n=1 Tax=Trichonephila inaurata madagascariensis TaxID=2747483 RepID=A0A8X6YS23_9ARAC|nr:hypothetical protein TNIN_140651 [Trichonephila inaurata madagascariensis]